MTNCRWMLVSVFLVVGCGDDNNPKMPDGGPTPDMPPAPVDITVTVGTGGGTFAYQDGDGPFTLATPENGVITFEVSSPRYGFARKCATGLPRLIYRAATESTLTLAPCGGGGGTGPTGELVGTLTTAGDALHSLSHGVGSFVELTDADQTSLPYAMSTSGTADFLAARQLGFDAPDRLHVERDVAVTGTSTVTRDLAFAGLDAPTTITQPVPNDAGYVYTYLIASTSAVYLDDLEPPYTFVAFPPAARRASDRYGTSVSVELTATSRVTTDRVVEVPTPFASLPTANLLDELAVDGSTITWNRVPDFEEAYAIIFYQGAGFGSVSFSPAWANAATTQRWQVPDLGTVAGWPASGPFRGPFTSVTLGVFRENKAFPEDGYESTSYERIFDNPSFAKRLRDVRAQREHARLRHTTLGR